MGLRSWLGGRVCGLSVGRLLQILSLNPFSSHIQSEGCDSEDELLTAVEKKNSEMEGKEFTLTDIFRKVEKLIVSRSLDEFLHIGEIFYIL